MPISPGSSGRTTAIGAWRRSCWRRASEGARPGDHRVAAPGLARRGSRGHRGARLHGHDGPGPPGSLHGGADGRREARGAVLRQGVVEGVVRRAGAARGVTVDGTAIEADAVVLAMGPWTGRVAGDLPLPRVHGLKGHSVTLAVAGVPAHALFMDYRMTDGRRLEPEIFPRPDGEVYVCGMADPAPLPDSPDAVQVSDEACAVLAQAAGRVSSRLAAAPVIRRQACYRPVTDDGLPLIGPVPGVAGAFVATGHGPWGMLNAPATGQALAELIVEGAAASVDLRPFDPAPAGSSPTAMRCPRAGCARRGPPGLQSKRPAIGDWRDRSLDGIHDLGGMRGFGPVEADPEERGFHARWEAQVVACVDAGIELAALHHRRVPPQPRAASAASTISRPATSSSGSTPPASSWWRRASSAGRSWRREPGSSPATRTARPGMRSRRGRRPPARASRAPVSAGRCRPRPRFRSGDPVVTRNLHPHGHTRLPALREGQARRRGRGARALGVRRHERPRARRGPAASLQRPLRRRRAVGSLGRAPSRRVPGSLGELSRSRVSGLDGGCDG